MQTDYVTSYRHENDITDAYQQLYEIRVKLSSIVTLVDRSTRYTFMAKVPFNTAQAVQEVICRCLSSVKEAIQKLQPGQRQGARTAREDL